MSVLPACTLIHYWPTLMPTEAKSMFQTPQELELGMVFKLICGYCELNPSTLEQ